MSIKTKNKNSRVLLAKTKSKLPLNKSKNSTPGTKNPIR